jgi:hypothetical protein
MGYLIAGALIFAIGTFFGAMMAMVIVEAAKKKNSNDSMPPWPN